MSHDPITIPEDLLRLKYSDALESISTSRLARGGSAMLRELTATAQAVAVKVQGQGAMVTLSQHQYDEIIELIQQLRESQSDDGFTQALSRQFDELVGKMEQPGAASATEEALFGDPAALNAGYAPGDTEAKV